MELKEKYYTEAEIADFLHKKVVTIRKDRYSNPDHPPSVKIGVLVLYPKDEFAAWVSRHKVDRPLGA